MLDGAIMSRSSYDPNSDEDPRHQQRGRDPRADENEAGGQQQDPLGALLGGILGNVGQHSAQEREPEPEQEQDPRMSRASSSSGGGSVGGGLLSMLLSNPRILMALLAAGGAVVMYFMKTHTETNPITDKVTRVVGEAKNDVALGLQAAPEMIQQYGGEHRDGRLRAEVERIGQKLVQSNTVGDWAVEFQKYQWHFHLLADEETINAFALPGGQIFFTFGLFKRLGTEDEVAGVLGHEIGHVTGRHSAQQMAKAELTGGLANAGAILASDGQSGGGGAQISQYIAQMVSLKYGREDESEADKVGVQYMINAGYNPGGLVRVMEILKESSGGKAPPEFMSSHPDPGNRIEHIKQVIEDVKANRLEGPKQAVRER